MTRALVLGLINTVCLLVAAPLLDGLLRRVTARIQSRQGPPLTQSYLDLLKLLAKEDIESGEAPVAQRAAAVLSLGAVLVAAWMTPMGLGAPLAAYTDGIVLIYVLTLCGAATAFAGLAAGSTYSLIGVSREVMMMILLEPLFAVAVLAASLHAGSLRLDRVLGGGVYAASGFPWSGVLLAVLMLLAFQAYVQRQPYDVTEAETEIMEGPLMEYSGPKLAMLKMARMAKLIVYSSLFLGLFAPWSPGPEVWVRWPFHWLKVLALALLVTLIANVHARVRVDQALRRYAVLYGVSLLALILAAVGY